MRRQPRRARLGKRYVIAYDVSDDRRRERLAGALLDVGVRVGLSLFVARLTRGELVTLVERAAELVDPSTDRVHLYRLCQACEAVSAFVGTPWPRERAAVEVL